ncbi:AMP-binding protein [Salinarimonas chemoclinalis]|uniref:AMP-binding protein n=1 Tax=Salinarimonas chemoclinalis TaxID=3241599 RepID=UPI003556FA0D
MLDEARDYDSLRRAFRWGVPERYNIGVDVCDRWAAVTPDRIAIVEVDGAGAVVPWSYGRLREASNRLANALVAGGIGPGDRVAILLPQSAAVAVAHVALYKIGAIALPLALLFGVDALGYRLADAGAKGLIATGAGLDKIAGLDLPDLACVLCVDGAISGPGREAASFHAALEAASPDFTARDTAADDPAMMIYTSGTTGQPKGALHAHRVLLGHLPGVRMHHEFLPQAGDRLWTPADWAWAGGLLNVLLPGLHFGVPVVARKFEKFEPDAAWRLLVEQEIANAFIPPTALRMLRAAGKPPTGLALRTVGSGGEALGAETFAWGREVLGLTINEFYGQTECNLVLSSCAAIGVARAGAIGKPVPGHVVAVIREDGTVCDPEEPGQIAVRRPDPVMFLGYWKREAATRAKFVGDWMTTGDQGVADADGYVRFVGRDDDLITSAGYRIGPAEIEDCLLRHPAVSLAAVVGKPDPVRTQIVKAFVVAREGVVPSDALVEDIRAFVRTRLSAHEYPREIVFRDSLPLTTTGKVIRRLLRDEA